MCDKSTPANCQIQTASVTILGDIVLASDSGNTTSGTPATPIANVAANDRVNGFSASLGASGNATIVQSGSWPAGFTLNPITGAVTTSASVQPGNYAMQYQLCDKSTPANCQVQSITVTVAGSIVPAADRGSAVSGAPSTPLANIVVNDSVNGMPARLGASGNATIAPAGSWPTGLTLNSETGAVSTNANVQPGLYALDYTLCDTSSPVNCQNQNITITVIGNIAPVGDSGAATSGAPSTPIANITTNDMVNGRQATLGGSGNATIATIGNWPAGIALNLTTGAVSTSSAVQPGTYPLQYQLCDKSSPVNCQTVTITVTVVGDIVPLADNGTAVSGSPSTPVANIAMNDMVNGVRATLGTGGNATTRASNIWPAGITLDTATGAVSTSTTVQPGTYALQYELCDRSPIANCRAQTVTIIVAGNILPMADSGTAVSGIASAPVSNLAANDTVNGVQATLGAGSNGTVSKSGTWPIGFSLDPATGGVSTSVAVQPGLYSLNYELCDKSSPANCQTQTATITIIGNILPLADSGIATSGIASIPVTNIAANDRVNGVLATLGANGNATVAQSGNWPNNISIDPMTGMVSTTPALQPGMYSLQYVLCDKSAPANCQAQSVTITVIGNIVPLADRGTATSGIASTPIATAISNDMVNGSPAALGLAGNATIVQSGNWPIGIVLNTATGAVSTSATLQPGSYEVTYQLCDKSTPANCQTTTVTITVAGNIVPTPDNGTATSGTPATPIANITNNDMVNGVQATLGASGNATVTQSGIWPTGLSLDPITGAVATSSSVQPGTYVMEYVVCDKSTPANCQTTTVTITVAGNITPTPDNGTATSGTPATPIANIANNDMVNGVQATLGSSGNATVAQSGIWPTGLSLDPITGAVATSSSVQPGTYVMEYILCDQSTPANCRASLVTISVAGSILPAADSGSATFGTAATPVANIAINDRVNGVQATLGNGGNATVSQSGAWPAGVVLDPTSGSVSTSATLPPGTYTLLYQLCDKSTPSNCATQTISLVVVESRGSIAGVVYSDINADGQRQVSEPPRVNWIVQLFVNGQPMATTTTDTGGNYRFDNLPQGLGYEIRFINPENNVVYGMIENVSVTASTTIADQNQPIDPAGVIFNSVTRAPVAGAIVMLVDASGAPLPASCYIDASQRRQRTGVSGEYRFDIVPGGAPQCPRSETVYRIAVTPPAGFSADSTVLLPLPGPFDPSGMGGTVRISPAPQPAPSGDVPYYLTFRLAYGDPDIVFNHIAIDPFLTRTPLVAIKTSTKRSASSGDLVPYEITVRNTENVRRAGVTIVDILPPGMKFVSGSATIDDIASTPIVGDRELTWINQIVPANASVRYRLMLIVGAGVTDGEKVNTGLARNQTDGAAISNRGTAVISIAPSAVFDCSEVVGKVFEDRNRNGYQDEDEPGVPGVRLATVNGQLITTDANGRYHIACAGVPDARIGSNFVLKVDTRSLPLSWSVTTDNPRSIRLTRGKFGELNFGVAPPQEPQTSAPRQAGEE